MAKEYAERFVMIIEIRREEKGLRKNGFWLYCNSKYSMINMNLMGKEMEGNQGMTMSKRDQGAGP